MSKNKNTSLSWEAFRQLGNPDRVLEESDSTEEQDTGYDLFSCVRVYIERKGRKGKTVTLIKGIRAGNDGLLNLTKQLKSTCGVGGGLESDDIMLQGDQRKKVIDKLLKMGFSDVKNAGA